MPNAALEGHPRAWKRCVSEDAERGSPRCIHARVEETSRVPRALCRAKAHPRARREAQDRPWPPVHGGGASTRAGGEDRSATGLRQEARASARARRSPVPSPRPAYMIRRIHGRAWGSQAAMLDHGLDAGSIHARVGKLLWSSPEAQGAQGHPRERGEATRQAIEERRCGASTRPRRLGFVTAELQHDEGASPRARRDQQKQRQAGTSTRVERPWGAYGEPCEGPGHPRARRSLVHGCSPRSSARCIHARVKKRGQELAEPRNQRCIHTRVEKPSRGVVSSLFGKGHPRARRDSWGSTQEERLCGYIHASVENKPTAQSFFFLGGVHPRTRGEASIVENPRIWTGASTRAGRRWPR